MDKHNSFSDQFKSEEINSKGFGSIPKLVMFDNDLTLEAKAIYAYFCSYSGRGDSSFPSRDLILHELSMSKSAYYKHFNLLVDAGYIIVNKSFTNSTRFSNNVYSLSSNPKKYIDIPVDDISTPANLLRSSLIKSKGYGIIPKSVMTNNNLNIKAKGIYAYFCSLTGNGDCCFPTKEQIIYNLKINKDTYLKNFKSLTELGYITSAQRHEQGRLAVKDYYLNDNPQLAKELYQIEQTKKRNTIITKKQYTEKQDTEKQYTKKQDTKKQDTINNSSINNSFINNNNIINNQQKQNSYPSDELTDNSIDDVILILKDQYDYPIAIKEPSWINKIDQLDNIIKIIATVIHNPQDSYSINKIAVPGTELVSSFMKINLEHIYYTIESVNAFIENGGFIKNANGFIISTLFNSVNSSYFSYVKKSNISNNNSSVNKSNIDKNKEVEALLLEKRKKWMETIIDK